MHVLNRIKRCRLKKDAIRHGQQQDRKEGWAMLVALASSTTAVGKAILDTEGLIVSHCGGRSGCLVDSLTDQRLEGAADRCVLK